jgi:uncharacterized zinc-type alcohol dehydrogenase-like protein
MKTYGFGTKSSDAKLAPVTFDRPDAGPGDVTIKITHCGVCHSDLHQARNDWENTLYPCVPGHEIVGVVTHIGDNVQKFSVGDRVGVGCMIDSCLECDSCKAGDENYCQGPISCTLTYNGSKITDDFNTYGGYSTDLIVREEFVLKIPDQLESVKAGPIMCAGITVYAPMKHWGLKSGDTLGVAGIGGLGHMAIKIGKVLGAKVVAFTRSGDKEDEILKMGADQVIVSTDEDQMAEAAQTIDLMINTIPVEHDIAPYIATMRMNSVLVVVGNMINFPEFSPGPLVFNRISLAGSLIGGIQHTQEVLELCAEHNIAPDVKLIGIDEINDVFDGLAAATDTSFRHVIDMETLRNHDSVANESLTTIADPERR